MTLGGVCLRSATGSWWRTFTLGGFAFSIAFLMAIGSSLSSAVAARVDTVIVQGLTGHVQVRSADTRESDMVEQYDTGWDDIAPLSPGAVNTVSRIAAEALPGSTLARRIRRSVSLWNGPRREQSLMIGVEEGFTAYREAFVLATGRPLSPASAREILLTREQATNLRVAVGDTVDVVARNAEGHVVARDFTVAGTGDFILLSLFSYKACFVDISSARELAGLAPGEATDLLVYLAGERNAAEGIAPERNAVAAGRLMVASSIAAGLPAVFQADERTTSADLSPEDGLYPGRKEPEKIRVSTWEDMGKTFRGVGRALSATLTLLAVLLMLIVSILIVNLVSLMGIERYREIGTLRAIGFSKGLVMRLLVGEIMAVSMAGALGGAALAVALALLLGRTGIQPPIPALEYVMGKTLYPRLDAGRITAILAIIVGFSFAASFLPAFRACSFPPARTLREDG